jgi:hypothetical protein
MGAFSRLQPSLKDRPHRSQGRYPMQTGRINLLTTRHDHPINLGVPGATDRIGDPTEPCPPGAVVTMRPRCCWPRSVALTAPRRYRLCCHLILASGAGGYSSLGALPFQLDGDRDQPAMAYRVSKLSVWLDGSDCGRRRCCGAGLRDGTASSTDKARRMRMTTRVEITDLCDAPM